MQSVKKHKYINPLINPGHSDITSHINFRLFYEILKENKLNVKKITTQNEFLKKIGIIERANILSKKMTFTEKANMFYRLKRLINYKEMGGLFKVLFAQKKDGKFSKENKGQNRRTKKKLSPKAGKKNGKGQRTKKKYINKEV